MKERWKDENTKVIYQALGLLVLVKTHGDRQLRMKTNFYSRGVLGKARIHVGNGIDIQSMYCMILEVNIQTTNPGSKTKK